MDQPASDIDLVEHLLIEFAVRATAVHYLVVGRTAGDLVVQRQIASRLQTMSLELCDLARACLALCEQVDQADSVAGLVLRPER